MDNAPFDVLFGRNLLFSPEINFFRDERGLHPINCFKEKTDFCVETNPGVTRSFLGNKVQLN
jgi:hypothetical protein